MLKKKASPPYLRVPHLIIQPTTYGKYSGKNISRIQKAELELLCMATISIAFTLY